MSDEIPLESILPEEAIAKIRNVSLAAIGGAIRLHATGTLETSGSVTPRLIDPTLLIDPALFFEPVEPGTPKKLSPLGLLIVSIIAQTILAFYGYYREDLRDASTEKFQEAIVKQVEEVFLTHKELPQPTPNKPHPPSQDIGRGDRRRRSSIRRGRYRRHDGRRHGPGYSNLS